MWWKTITLFVILACGLCNCDAVDQNEDRFVELKAMFQTLHAKYSELSNRHVFEMTNLRRELEMLREETHLGGNGERNEQLTLQWARTAFDEIRVEMHELETALNASDWREEMRQLRNQVAASSAEATGAATRLAEGSVRLDALSVALEASQRDLALVKRESAEARAAVKLLSKELKASQLEWKSGLKALSEKNTFEQEEMDNALNVVMADDHKSQGARRVRHERARHEHALHRQLTGLAHEQRALRYELMRVQAKVSKKVDFLSKEQRARAINVTAQIDGFGNVRKSMLELLENVESLETKVEKVLPDFRNEISRLDINLAQVNSSHAYLQRDHENLRMSVKAIAVSVSNVMDKADADRERVAALNVSVMSVSRLASQHFHRLNDHIFKSEVNEALPNKTVINIDKLPELMGEVKNLQIIEKEYLELVSKLPHDCEDIADAESGEYMLAPGPGAPVDTACFANGTLLQRRYDGSVEFNRPFAEYAAGFGAPDGEFWIGNEAMHRLTADNCSSMRIDMTDIYGKVWYAQYNQFTVGSLADGYRVHVAGYSGNASDAFSYHNDMQFSALDRDLDASRAHCAANYEGGWWFSHCQHVNLNGRYTLGLTWFDSSRNEWIAVVTSRMLHFRRARCDD